MSVFVFYFLFFFFLFFFIFIFFVFFFFFSFLRNLNVELCLAIFALELVIFGNIKFACTSWAERDFGLHAV